MDGERSAAGVEAAVDLVAPVMGVVAIHDQRQVAVDVSVAGVNIEVRGKVSGHSNDHAAIGGFDAGSRGELRTIVQNEFELAIRSANLDGGETPVNVHAAVGGVRLEGAAGIVNADGAVAGGDAQ